MYSTEEICKAVEAVNSGRLSVREAAKVYKISKSIIDRKRHEPVVEAKKQRLEASRRLRQEKRQCKSTLSKKSTKSNKRKSN